MAPLEAARSADGEPDPPQLRSLAGGVLGGDGETPEVELERIEASVSALADRTAAFVAASAALRAEIESFSASVTASGRALPEKAPPGPRIRLVAAEPEPPPEADEDEPTPQELSRIYDEWSAPVTQSERRVEERRSNDRRRPRSEPPRGAAPGLARHEKLLFEVGGALVGLGSAFALIRFVLLG